MNVADKLAQQVAFVLDRALKFWAIRRRSRCLLRRSLVSGINESGLP